MRQAAVEVLFEVANAIRVSVFTRTGYHLVGKIKAGTARIHDNK